MTDQVKEVSGTQGASSGGNYSGGVSFEGHKNRGAMTSQADLVEISRAARKRQSGKKRKNIFEYLKELFGYG